MIDKKLIDIEDLEVQLNVIDSLMWVLHSGFFKYDKECFLEDSNKIDIEYDKYSDLFLTAWDKLKGAQETLSIVQENLDNCKTDKAGATHE